MPDTEKITSAIMKELVHQIQAYFLVPGALKSKIAKITTQEKCPEQMSIIPAEQESTPSEPAEAVKVEPPKPTEEQNNENGQAKQMEGNEKEDSETAVLQQKEGVKQSEAPQEVQTSEINKKAPAALVISNTGD